jgi:hypothetical protein
MTQTVADLLGLAAADVRGWFAPDAGLTYSLVRMSQEHARALPGRLAVALRRSYIDDEALRSRVSRPTPTVGELLSALLPDPGSTMAGDFGEILTLVYLASEREADRPFAPLKWRMKLDRRQPVPHSDVLLFIVPKWPLVSPEDSLLCAEVKTKSTDSGSTPIDDAIRDSTKDRTSRLAKTLVWLQEKSLFGPIGGLDKPVLDRFCHASEHPQAIRAFAAVAVIDDQLVAHEVATVPAVPPDTTLVVIAIPELQGAYAATFEAARHAELSDPIVASGPPVK